MARLRFPTVGAPVASIVLLAWRQHELLRACLRSLHDTLGSEIPYEVIVVFNGAAQSIKDALRSHVEGVHFVDSAVNLGFAGGCNLGAGSARGRYIVLLNDDTIVAPGWLEWLVSAAEAHPEAGAVGSLILFPDGRIQEAGSIIWADGSTMPIGRDLSSDSIAWQFVRKVDYVSACSLLVRREAWEEVGGLDSGYHPAYYEDVDFCLALRERRYDVLFEPRSRAWHHESASSADDFKRFLFERNQRRLRNKWELALTRQEPAQPQSPAAITRAIWRARGTPTRVLVIDDRVPEPSLGSGYGRMFDAILAIAGAGHAVSMYPMSGATGRTTDALTSASVTVVDGLLVDHLATPWVTYDIAIISRPHNFERAWADVRRYQPHAVLVYDCEALFWRRTALQASLVAAPERTALLAQAHAMRQFEEHIVVEADYAVTVSRDEADMLAAVDGSCPIAVLLPAEPSVRPGPEGFGSRHGVGYVAGWMAGTTSPNADGLRWFVAEVLPFVVARIPWVIIRVTGANPPPDLLELAGPNLRFEGHVADIAEFYGAIRVAIAPIRFGAGVKVKTVQAMQHGVPVVATTCGTEGIEQHGIEALQATDEPSAFADRLVALLSRREDWELARTKTAEVVSRWQHDTSSTWPEVVSDALKRRSGDRFPLREYR